MTKSQFNIKISKDLLKSVKKQAIRSGKTLSEHITDLITKSLGEVDIQDEKPYSTNNIMKLEERLLIIESIVRNRENLSSRFKSFTDNEAKNSQDL